MLILSNSRRTVWGSGPSYTYQQFLDWSREEHETGYYGALYWARASRIGAAANDLREEAHFDFHPNAPELEDFIFASKLMKKVRSNPTSQP